MKTYTIPGWLKMGTPPDEQGQIQSCSYGIDLQSGVAVKRVTDRSDNSETWYLADLTDEEMARLEHHQPANGAPLIEGEWIEVEVRHK